MCLILFAYRQHPKYTLVVAANRDEQYAREATCAHRWQDHPQIVAGRDMVAGGTWLGVTDAGRLAAVTNFSKPDLDLAEPKSRGELIRNFLASDTHSQDYAHRLIGADYQGFNLLLYDGNSLVVTSNRTESTFTLEPGYYALSNAALNCNWPKVVDGMSALETLLSDQADIDALLDLLHDRQVAEDGRLPKRGNPIEFERRVGSRFIVGDDYGTRASTAVLLADESWKFSEQSYGPGGEATFRVDFISG